MNWRSRTHLTPELDREIEIYELELELRKKGKLDERVFAESRLRRGAYGQRYDNGRRHDGKMHRVLSFPTRTTKGPSTEWDAPGMQRIKVPFGGLTPEQLETLADLAEEYSDGIAHVTTRQDIQLHFVHIEDTPDLMRRLGHVGITTREACGNSVRNITACPLAGVCHSEGFDVTPHAHALASFLLGHPDTQDLGRKFKISFSGCREEACGLATMHDLGFIAKREGGKRGFEVWIGGGLGAVPHQAQLLEAFVPEEDLLPLSQAVCRVFARLGEKRNRSKARLKFLVAKLGLEETKRLVREERKILPHDERWTAWRRPTDVSPRTDDLVRLSRKGTTAFERWKANNVTRQRQAGYSVVAISLPLGDLTAKQLRALADVGRDFLPKDDGVDGHPIRTTVEQNIVLRFVQDSDLLRVFERLQAEGLADPFAGSIVDVTSCPGTDTCKLGISSSRGLAAELRAHLAAKSYELDEAVQGLRIKVSGCFNSCGQHHVADLGFYGVSRKKGTHVVPHFQVVVGGEWKNNARSFGLAIGAIPSKRIPEVVDRFLALYANERTSGETFQAFITRIGKVRAKAWVQDLIEIPAFELSPGLYSDFGDSRAYTMEDHGVGECAGAVVSRTEFGLEASERRVFEAQLQLEAGRPEAAVEIAKDAMLVAARALIEGDGVDPAPTPQLLVSQFQERFYDTKRFFDPYAGGKFAAFLIKPDEVSLEAPLERARQRVEEAQLFIEAAHACHERSSQGVSP